MNEETKCFDYSLFDYLDYLPLSVLAFYEWFRCDGVWINIFVCTDSIFNTCYFIPDWGKGKWLAPIVFGIMHMLAEYLTFSLKNMVSISFHRINAPNLELLFAGIVLYEISVGAGHFIYRKKLKHK